VASTGRQRDPNDRRRLRAPFRRIPPPANDNIQPGGRRRLVVLAAVVSTVAIAVLFGLK